MILNRIELPKGLLAQRPAQQDRPFFNRASGTAFEVLAQEEVTEIDLYDEIGIFGVTAGEFKRQLDAVTTAQGLLKINSPGGDVFDGIAMHNDLAAHSADWTVRVTGVAASAASVVAMGGDRIEIVSNGFFMIHNAWGMAIGDRHDMTAFADILEQVDGALAETYAARTGKTLAAIGKLLDAETWLNGKSAVKEGFADATVAADGSEAQARFDLSGFKNLPKQLAKGEPPAPRTVRDLERSLRDAGYSRSDAKDLAIRAFADKPLRDAGVLTADIQDALDRLVDAMSA